MQAGNGDRGNMLKHRRVEFLVVYKNGNQNGKLLSPLSGSPVNYRNGNVYSIRYAFWTGLLAFGFASGFYPGLFKVPIRPYPLNIPKFKLVRTVRQWVSLHNDRYLLT